MDTVHFLARGGGVRIALDVQPDFLPVHLRVERAVLAIAQFPPRDNPRMRKDRLGIQPDHAHQRLILRQDVKNIARLEHCYDAVCGCRNRLMPGLKITLLSTTTSSSSR